MSATMLQYGLDKLSADERLALADELYESVNDEDDEPLPPELELDLQRRIAMADIDPKRR